MNPECRLRYVRHPQSMKVMANNQPVAEDLLRQPS